jgi:hypothetical protein
MRSTAAGQLQYHRAGRNVEKLDVLRPAFGAPLSRWQL